MDQNIERPSLPDSFLATSLLAELTTASHHSPKVDASVACESRMDQVHGRGTRRWLCSIPACEFDTKVLFVFFNSLLSLTMTSSGHDIRNK